MGIFPCPVGQWLTIDKTETMNAKMKFDITRDRFHMCNTIKRSIILYKTINAWPMRCFYSPQSNALKTRFRQRLFQS